MTSRLGHMIFNPLCFLVCLRACGRTAEDHLVAVPTCSAAWAFSLTRETAGWEQSAPAAFRPSCDLGWSSSKFGSWSSPCTPSSSQAHVLSAGASSSFPESSGSLKQRRSGVSSRRCSWEKAPRMCGSSGMRTSRAPIQPTGLRSERPRVVPGADVCIARKRVCYTEGVDRLT